MRNRTNHDSKTKSGKKMKLIAAVLCLFAAVGTGFGVAGYREKLQAQSDQVITRGVIDGIGQIPLTKKDMYEDPSASVYELGTKENPFLILEVVPYEEYGSYGYLIDGCEPVDVQAHQGTASIMDVPKGLKTATVELQGKTYWFPEEPEADASLYDEAQVPRSGESDNVRVLGYYEKVEDGQGHFRQEADGRFVKADGGNVIWHSLCKTERETDFKNQTFQKAEDTNTKLEKVGDRIFTERMSAGDDLALVTYGYYYYKNKETFLTHSLNLTEEEAKNYSVVIKTITPKELNSDPKWADYADLYIFSRKESYTGGIVAAWKEGNRLGHQADSTQYVDNFVNTASDKNRDITWEVVSKMYRKIMAKKNYAAIVMGSSLYSLNEESLEGSIKKGCDFNLYDWNMEKTDAKFTDANEMKSNNNVYRLALMLLSMEPNLFDHLYMDPENPYIDENGKFILREGEDQEYWSMYTFLLIDPTNEEAVKNPYKYWTYSDDYRQMWEKYGILGNISIDRSWIKGRFFSYNDDNTLSFEYVEKETQPEKKFSDYQNYLDEFYDGKNCKGTPSDAVRYILGMQKSDDDLIDGTLHILDIEPSYDVDKGYSLKKSYVYMMIPKFKGDVEITHMTTAEFIGNRTDLNSTYQMVYMGLDSGAYNYADQWLAYVKKQTEAVKWNDADYNSQMPGKIYFHTGDKMDAKGSAVGGQGSTVEYLWSLASGQNVTGQTLRFSGNDITNNKIKDLEEFIDAGYPVVAAPYLYQTDNMRIDQNSNICKFIKKQKADTDATLYAATDALSIMKCVKKQMPQVTFDNLPKEYPDYISRDTKGRSLLDYKFTVKDEGNHAYGYRVYIDWDHDGTYADTEVVAQGDVADTSGKTTSAGYAVSKQYVGPIEWKLEVYRKGNESIHFVRTGISKAANKLGKTTIHVLQLMPKAGSYQGAIDLSSDTDFTKYYTDIDDYDIDVDTMTVEEYQKLFNADKPFVYDYTKVDTDGNIAFPTEYSDEQMEIYTNYDLIVMGFGESYAGVNINNYYGAVDFLRFYLQEGLSILFTHDQTSVYNTNKDAAGYTMNTLMRDLMGMNRYQAVNSVLSDAEHDRLLAYQKAHDYDTVTSVNDGSPLEEKHGYTYYAMKRLGANSNETQSMPYKKLTGFNDLEDLTTKATSANRGMITEYPYVIDDTIPVAKTHAQWYQLNMEDADMRVWYCLADDGTNTSGTAMTYGVSPNDVANNYYVYSKGNVYYSGIGHSSTIGEMEAKLFVNTMVGAYNASAKRPKVEIQNPEAELTDFAKMAYRMTFAQEYNDNGSGDGYTGDGATAMLEGATRTNNDTVQVFFSPLDFNSMGVKLDCSLYYEVDGKRYYIDSIFRNDGTDAADATLHPDKDKDGNPVYKNLTNGGEYYFYYPKKFLYEWSDGSGTQTARRDVKFYITNNRTRLPGKTSLDLHVRALFQLD